TLNATITGGAAASGTSSIVDDGSGKIYDRSGQPLPGAGDDDRPVPPAPPPPPGSGVVPPTTTFAADLDPASDNGASNADHVTSVLNPDFVINAGALLAQ